MGWETCALDERMRFVLAVEAAEEPTAALGRRFGVSRRIGYKWLDRYRAKGVAGPVDRSRARLDHPQAVAAELLEGCLAVRRAYPTWGAVKAEHLMLLDLGLNDVGRVARIGTVAPNEQFIIERYSHVIHIVSNVDGKLAEGHDALSALLAGLPAGTVSGTPKVRAMQIIDELEAEKRGVYGGGVGYFAAQGDMDICIALRTAVVKDGTLYIQAGGGVVYDSDPEAEYQESINKSKALLQAAREASLFVSARAPGNQAPVCRKAGPAPDRRRLSGNAG